MPNYSKGDRVSQATYGAGTLTELNEHHTVIDFDNHGIRRFVTKMVVLQATDEPAPARSKTTRRRKAAAPKAKASGTSESN